MDQGMRWIADHPTAWLRLGAERFLRADGVDAAELSRLFDLAGWTQPHSFTQTLRNAARSKFRWIERMPGRNGRYWVTERGKEIARQG